MFVAAAPPRQRSNMKAQSYVSTRIHLFMAGCHKTICSFFSIFARAPRCDCIADTRTHSLRFLCLRLPQPALQLGVNASQRFLSPNVPRCRVRQRGLIKVSHKSENALPSKK